ncbi:MAG: 50S ribosomal protein L28 [Planctomycetes bacterium]|nr:50S ribosomal protein L28 [Planctomycetota bacterium]
MPRVCHFTGARTTVGRRIKYRGKPKYQGGIGLKVTAISKRTFKPNLQTVTAIVDGRPKRVKASAKAIKRGLVVKPLKRKYGYTRQQAAAGANS